MIFTAHLSSSHNELSIFRYFDRNANLIRVATDVVRPTVVPTVPTDHHSSSRVGSALFFSMEENDIAMLLTSGGGWWPVTNLAGREGGGTGRIFSQRNLGKIKIEPKVKKV